MLYIQTIAPSSLELLKDLMQRDYLRQFVLVGGTALSLQIGHRKSYDLDMFSTTDFKADKLVNALIKHYDLVQDLLMDQTLLCKLNGVKVDFIRFKYEMQYHFVEKEGIRMLAIEDIAPMKLDAITGRGRKRDFYDLYFLLKQFDLDTLFKLYLGKYPHQTTFHVLRSLSYFVDAEGDTDPFVFDKKLTWEKVKKAIVKEIRKI